MVDKVTFTTETTIAIRQLAAGLKERTAVEALDRTTADLRQLAELSGDPTLIAVSRDAQLAGALILAERVLNTSTLREWGYPAAAGITFRSLYSNRRRAVFWQALELGQPDLGQAPEAFDAVACIQSAAQFRKLDRNPCGTAGMPSSLINFDSVMLESGFPRRLRNTRLVPSLSLCTSCRIASARPESGTR